MRCYVFIVSFMKGFMWCIQLYSAVFPLKQVIPVKWSCWNLEIRSNWRTPNHNKTKSSTNREHNGLACTGHVQRPTSNSERNLHLSEQSWSEIPGLYSLSRRTSYHEISGSLEAARFGFRFFQSLRNLTGTSAATLQRCLSNSRAIRSLWHPISRLRDFTRLGGIRLVNTGPESQRILKTPRHHNCRDICKNCSSDCKHLCQSNKNYYRFK